MADFWTGGDCDRARKMPRSLFNEILGLCIAQEQGKAIEAENQLRESERQSRLNQMRRAT